MKPLKALIVEDSELDEELLLRQLAKADYDVQSIRVQTAADMEKALGELEWDIILSDYVMPGFTGLDALRVLKESGHDIPLIIISGTIGEDVAVEAMRIGVDDYLIKGNLTRLVPAIERELENAASRRAQKKTEEALRRSEASLANAQRIAHIGNWETDLLNNRLFWSDEVYRIFGVSKDDFGGTLESFINFIHPEDRQSVQAVTDAAMSGNAPYNIEHRIVRPDGEIRFVCEFGEVTFDKSGRPIRFIGTVQDISERKKAEGLLLESEEKFRSIVETTSEWIWAFDSQGNCSYSNPALETILGYAPEEVIGKSFLPLMYEEEREKIRQLMPNLIADKRGWTNLVLRWYHKDGRIRYLESNAIPLLDSGGEIIGYRGSDRDITESRRAEEKLRQSETNLAAAQRITHLGSWEVQLSDLRRINNNKVHWSDEVYRIFGYEPEQIDVSINRYFNSIHPDDRKYSRRAFVELITEKKDLNIEFRISLPNGGERILHGLAEVIYDRQTNKPHKIIGTVQDITDRKSAEDEKALLAAQIERQHERLNNVIANVPGVVWEAWGSPDAATQRIDFVSDYVETMLGYTVEEWLTTPNFWLSIVHPEDKERIAREATGRYLTGEGYTRQFRWIAKDGHIVCVESQATVIRDESGQPIGLRGINIDITERRRLEAERTNLLTELASEKARLQHIFDNSPSFIVSMHGPDFVFEMANPAYYQLVGQRDLIGLPASEALPEVMTQGLSEIIRQVYNTGEPFIGNEVPVKLQPQDGSELEQHYVNFVYMPLRETDNSISGIVSYGMDVTEQVLARTKIQESEERYRFLFENNPLPMWVFDVETLAFLSVNDAAIAHYGFTLEEFLTMTVKDIRPPEDIPAFLQNVVIDMPGIMNAGVRRHIKKDGTLIEVEVTTNQLIFNGKKAKLVLANDVTERQKAEESVRFQAHLLNTVEQSVIATDLNGIVTYWNRFAEKLYGWTDVEAVGRTILELNTPEINLEQANQILARLSAGESWTGEFVVRNKAGENFPAYVSNSPVNDDTGRLVGIVGVSVDITERKNAETALRQAEDKYRRLVESSPAIIYLSEPIPPYSPIYVSPNIVKFGYSTEEWFSRDDLWISLIHPEDRERVLRITANAMRQGLETDLEYRIIAGGGAIHWLQDRGRFILDEQGNRTGWQGVMLDITETKILEEQLRQSQKLESVGRLAGGIAHDFNNMLTAINGYSELTLRKLDADSPLRRNIEEIKKAGERSAQLTHQLLAFSRQQVLQPVVLDLNEVITDTIVLLRRLIGEDVELVTALNPKTGRVSVDPGQLSQIMMNLAVNARDAMPHGGKLTIETSNVFLKPKDVRQKSGVLPGAYVILAVCDTGDGMDEGIQAHIFEPFFTTKETGKGTGLGLATVYGIVKQSGGNIEVESRRGIGTTFKVYLPRVEELAAVEAENAFVESSTGTETILLVEDEELVRNLSREILESSGYTVIEARDGLEALEICKNGEIKFDLLMTDVVMPGMGGREIAEKLSEKMPEIKILFTSGYTNDAIIKHGISETKQNFIQKPFTFADLSKKVRDIIDNVNL